MVSERKLTKITKITLHHVNVAYLQLQSLYGHFQFTSCAFQILEVTYTVYRLYKVIYNMLYFVLNVKL